MNKDKHETKVNFLCHKDGEVFAYFPNEIADSEGNRTSYQHIGQHSACSPEYIKECMEAKPEEYADLQKELESIGYNLKVMKPWKRMIKN